MKKLDNITKESIKILIDKFYQKIRVNDELKDIFAKAIGHDDLIWQDHLKIMYNFWASIVLGTKEYNGNPLQKHMELDSFSSDKFDIWLKLFSETANEVHNKDIADKYIEVSNRIARSLKLGLYGFNCS
ncbi:MAG: group III truncated hemoglobin [Candidatus Rickettsia vulgarisii]